MQNSIRVRTVELLAPAKDYASAVVAVDAGADAVYIGGARFGARQAAGNAAEEIARVAAYAHRFGVRVHATLNTLLWDEELADAERQARELIDAGVDALIVQDMALRRMNLPVELHASTQVSNRTPEGARFLSIDENLNAKWYLCLATFRNGSLSRADETLASYFEKAIERTIA